MGSQLPERNIALQMASFVSIPETVAETDMIAVVPSRLALQLRQEGRLRCLDLPFECPEIEVRLYWHKSREKDRGHRWIAELMQSTAAELPRF